MSPNSVLFLVHLRIRFPRRSELLPEQINTLVEILGHVPKSIIQDEIVSVIDRSLVKLFLVDLRLFQLLPILIRALSSTNESIWSSALNSICDLIKTDPKTISDHLDSLVPRLSTLATYPKDMVKNDDERFRFNSICPFLGDSHHQSEMFEISDESSDSSDSTFSTSNHSFVEELRRWSQTFSSKTGRWHSNVMVKSLPLDSRSLKRKNVRFLVLGACWTHRISVSIFLHFSWFLLWLVFFLDDDVRKKVLVESFLPLRFRFETELSITLRWWFDI